MKDCDWDRFAVEVTVVDVSGWSPRKTNHTLVSHIRRLYGRRCDSPNLLQLNCPGPGLALPHADYGCVLRLLACNIHLEIREKITVYFAEDDNNL
jgi:hypothetical protein